MTVFITPKRSNDINYTTATASLCNDSVSCDGQPAPARKAKRYYLEKVPAKHSFTYYVRYLENGKRIPSRWNTRTQNREEAEAFALANRERLIAQWKAGKAKRETLDNVLNTYFLPGSPYLEEEKLSGRTMTEHTRIYYHNFLIKTVLPYFRKECISTWGSLTVPTLAGLQMSLLRKKNKPQTVNRKLAILKAVCDSLYRKGIIHTHPFALLKPLTVRRQDLYNRGCYDITGMKDTFRTRWRDSFSYLLNLTIYTTGLRNSEIEALRVEDILCKKGVHFFNIRESKTVNGVRLVPVHPRLYQALQAHIKKHRITDFIYSPGGKHIQAKIYREAALGLGKRLNRTGEDLTEERITYYSGRYFYRTLLDAEGLKDVDEYFMGHKVSRDVTKRYNHKDKQGINRLTGKAKEVIKALDKYLFP